MNPISGGRAEYFRWILCALLTANVRVVSPGTSNQMIRAQASAFAFLWRGLPVSRHRSEICRFSRCSGWPQERIKKGVRFVSSCVTDKCPQGESNEAVAQRCSGGPKTNIPCSRRYAMELGISSAAMALTAGMPSRSTAEEGAPAQIGR